MYVLHYTEYMVIASTCLYLPVFKLERHRSNSLITLQVSIVQARWRGIMPQGAASYNAAPQAQAYCARALYE